MEQQQICITAIYSIVIICNWVHELLYMTKLSSGNFHVLSEKWLFTVKLSLWHLCRLIFILPIDKDMICSKRLAIEWKTVKVLPHRSFAIYSNHHYTHQDCKLFTHKNILLNTLIERTDTDNRHIKNCLTFNDETSHGIL